MFCKQCGAVIADNAQACPKCGATLSGSAKGKSWLAALLLCLFFGVLGVHRFYTGRVGSGIAQLVTFGGCGIWTLVDFIRIITGSFTDVKGNKLVKG